MRKIIYFIESLILKYPLIWQFVKFCLVGVTNLALSLGVYWLLTRLLFWHYLPASVIGFIIAVTWSFFVNRKWTFKHDGNDHGRQYVTFVAANLIGMAINLALLTLFIEFFKIFDIAAQLICSVIVAFINFGLNRFWTFKKA